MEDIEGKLQKLLMLRCCFF